VGEVAHLCMGKEYWWRGMVGGVVALPERVLLVPGRVRGTRLTY
jgi:hypothetical protein